MLLYNEIPSSVSSIVFFPATSSFLLTEGVQKYVNIQRRIPSSLQEFSFSFLYFYSFIFLCEEVSPNNLLLPSQMQMNLTVSTKEKVHSKCVRAVAIVYNMRVWGNIQTVLCRDHLMIDKNCPQQKHIFKSSMDGDMGLWSWFFFFHCPMVPLQMVSVLRSFMDYNYTVLIFSFFFSRRYVHCSCNCLSKWKQNAYARS